MSSPNSFILTVSLSMALRCGIVPAVSCELPRLRSINFLEGFGFLPRPSHTGIVHCTALLQSIFNCVINRSSSLLRAALSCPSVLVRQVFSDSSVLAYTPTGFNVLYGHRYSKAYSSSDISIARLIRSFRLSSSFTSEQLIVSLACN